MHLTIPLGLSEIHEAPKGALCVSGGESGMAEAARVRRIRLERIRTAWVSTRQRGVVMPRAASERK